MNGTFVNGRRLQKGVKEVIESGQEISFVAVSAKRQRSAHVDGESTPATSSADRVVTYIASFDFHIDKEQQRVRYHSAQSDASTVVATPASLAFPADPAAMLQDQQLLNGQSLALNPSVATILPSVAPNMVSNSQFTSLLTRQPSRPKVLHWQWGECVGVGSFAEVYIGIDTDTAKMIAIKRMKQTIDGAQPSLASLNAYSDTLRDWGVDPNDMFDPNSDSQLDDILHTRTIQRKDSENDNAAQQSNPSSAGSPRVCAVTGCSPTDPSASTMPMVSKAVLRRDYSTTEEYTGLSLEQHAEVDLLKSLTHPCVVHYYGFAIEDNHLCILLEFVAGGSLVSLQKKFGAFQESVVRIYTTQALQGLEYLHDKGVVHGDIKPGNFLVTDKGRVKLSDFGTGRIVSSAASNSQRNGGRKTILQKEESLAPTTLTGTPAYMSPEMVRTNKSTFASDIWALGGTVMELFTGQAPWQELGLEHNAMGLVFQIGTRNEAPSMSKVVEKGGSEAFIHFLNCCFTLNPEERPTATDMLSHPFISPDSAVTLATWRPMSIIDRYKSPSVLGSSPSGANTPGSQRNPVNGGYFGTSPGGRSLFGDVSDNAIAIPPPPPPPQNQSQPNGQDAKVQQAVTGELIGQHQQYLHSLARNALKKVPSVIGTPSAAHDTPALGQNVKISAPFPAIPQPQGKAATSIRQIRNTRDEGAYAGEGDSAANDGGLHTGLTAKMRRVELDPSKEKK